MLQCNLLEGYQSAAIGLTVGADSWLWLVATSSCLVSGLPLSPLPGSKYICFSTSKQQIQSTLCSIYLPVINVPF